MAVTVFNDAPAREDDSRAVGASIPLHTTPAALPSDSCAERYEFPTPNIATLKALLRWHGYAEPFVEAFAEGYAPREFQIGTTGGWKVRDAFYLVAFTSALYFIGKKTHRLGIGQILAMIVENAEQHNVLFHDLEAAANSVMWTHRASSTGIFLWPTYIPSCTMSRDLLTAISLCVLHTIWSSNPEALLPVDFSAGLANFSNEECALIQKLIYDAIQSRPALPESEAKSNTETTVEAGESALTAEVHRLLVILQDGPKSRQELQELLGVGRSVLLNRFLDPARESSLVMTTEQGSSPNQKYTLTSSTAAANKEQAQPESETGLKKPVSSNDVPPQKQADLPKNGVFSPVAVSIFAGGHAPVRLARYNRWPEAERALILYDRVERFLRSSFGSDRWKELGIVNKLNESDLFRFEYCLFDPKYWGANADVVLRQEVVDSKNKCWALAVGESSLLHLFAQKTGFDLAVCSETERAKMGRLKEIIPLAEFYLMNFYAQRFGISDELDKPYHGEKKAMQPDAVDLFNLYHYGKAKIVFHGKNCAPQFQMARLDVAGRTVLQPITFYASSLNPTLYSMMLEVPDPPALYNADAIAANPGATVILTDELGIPLVNDNNSGFIYCSWYGGMDVIDKLDRDLLEGHPLNWLCFDNGNDPAEKYEKALRVKAIFQKHGLEIAFFHVFDNVTWTPNVFGMDTGIYKGSRVHSFAELKTEAAKYGVNVGESSVVASADLRVHSMADLMALKPKDFTLYPLLKEGFYCLIFGGTGVAKTWFALHLAIALSQGETPFDRWKFQGKAPLNVLYVAGEMKPEEYGSRLRTLLADQKTNARFRLVREDLDLVASEDQERVIKAVNDQKSQVVVLDNLSTLATNGHTEGRFEKVLALIRKLQAIGIIVILVHHENRKGGFKGSSKIELVSDQSLHLFPAGNGEKIELLVQAEKIRMTSKAEQTAFHATFDPNQPTAVWATKDLTPEECRRLDEDDPLGEVEMNVGKKRNDKRPAWRFLNDDDRAIAIIDDTLSGCQDDVIAANLAVRVIAITKFKRQFGITEEALKQCMPMARESAEKNQGKITTDILAVEIWKSLKDKA